MKTRRMTLKFDNKKCNELSSTIQTGLNFRTGGILNVSETAGFRFVVVTGSSVGWSGATPLAVSDKL